MGKDRDHEGSAHALEIRTVLESLQENVVYYDREMRILWANSVACGSAATDLETLKRHHCWEVCGDRRPAACVSWVPTSGRRWWTRGSSPR
jgi:PAS domain-containing protein